jgi:hypothetical protein
MVVVGIGGGMRSTGGGIFLALSTKMLCLGELGLMSK